MTSFPLQQARTRRFTLGIPRAFVVGAVPDSPAVLFLRSDSGTDPVTHLWRHDPLSRATTKLVDARELGADDDLPAPERARRERARELAAGITSYACDRDATVASFAVAGRLFTVDVSSGHVAEHPTNGAAFDPRPSPDGSRIAFHADDGLQVVELADGPAAPGHAREVIREPGVAWGRAEFVAAEEMLRGRGFWWSPDSTRIVAARVDERGVPMWHISDPSNPGVPPREHRYPAAGTANAEVSLAILDVGTGERTAVRWDRLRDEYLAGVSWGPGPLTMLVQPRDQRVARVLVADPSTGDTEVARLWEDDAWVDLVPGTPAWAGRVLITVEDRGDRGPGGTRTLCADGGPLTPVGLQVREVVHASEGLVAFLASGADPTQIHGYRLNLAAPSDLTVWSVTEAVPGVHREIAGASPAGPWVGVSQTLEDPQTTVTVTVPPAAGSGAAATEHHLDVVAEVPVITASPRMVELGPRRLRGALFLPTGDDGRSPLPTLLDPYGGPHVQRVLRAHSAHLTSQWLADQGFAVLVVDARGSPGRGPAWERAIRGDLATVVLDDQIDALHAAVRLEPRLDLSRVGIRGWSFGGFIAALAVLRRPDVFRAGIAGAPVTDWHLYDTHYTERYLGHPHTQPAAYALSSLVDGDGRLVDAAPWPVHDPPSLLLIHGLADDNVVAAHGLRLSSALLADGRTHRFLPLSGITHMTPQEVVAEQLLVQQAAFLHEALGH